MPNLRPSILLLSGALLFSSGPLRADDATEVRFWDGVARQAYAKGQYDKALAAFLSVSNAVPSPRALYNVALCADLAQHTGLAFAYFREYLATPDDDAERRKDAEQRLVKIEKALALIEVRTDPPGASIYVDRPELGLYGQAPRTIVVPAGERTILLERPGYVRAQRAVTAQSGAVTSMDVRLEARFGALTLNVVPTDAKVTLEPEAGGSSLEVKSGWSRLPVGAYEVRAEARGHAEARGRVIVREGEDVELQLALVALAKPTGRLLVAAGVTGASVSVNGQVVGVTPATLPEMPAGSYSVVVTAKNGKRWSTTAKVVEGKTLYVYAPLRRGRGR